MSERRVLLPGLLLSGMIGLLAYVLWWMTHGIVTVSPLLWAFALSLILGNAVQLGARTMDGIHFASKKLLRMGVGALGIVVSASAWWRLGGTGVAVVLLNLLMTLLMGILVCRVALKLTMKQALLITTGTAICGASAIAATAPAIEAKEEDTAMALAVVTVFGLIAMFLYPVLFKFTAMGRWLGSNPLLFGVWSGTGIHETAQVIASASQVDGALEMATLAKSVRILMIGPVVLLAVLAYRRNECTLGNVSRQIPWPWFALVFVGLTFLHLALEAWIGSSWVEFSKTWLKPIIKGILTWSFAAVGLRVKFKALKQVGGRAIAAGFIVAIASGALALLLTGWLM